MNPRDIRADLKNLRNMLRGRHEELYADPQFQRAIDDLDRNDMRKLESEYFGIMDEVGQGRKILTDNDWSEIDRRQQAFLDGMDPALRERFEQNLQLRDSVVDAHPLIREYKADLRELREYFDVRDQAWTQIASKTPALAQFKDYDAYEQALTERLMSRGMAEQVARTFVRSNTAPIRELMSLKATAYLLRNRDLVPLLAKWGYDVPNDLLPLVQRATQAVPTTAAPPPAGRPSVEAFAGTAP